MATSHSILRKFSHVALTGQAFMWRCDRSQCFYSSQNSGKFRKFWGLSRTFLGNWNNSRKFKNIENICKNLDKYMTFMVWKSNFFLKLAHINLDIYLFSGSIHSWAVNNCFKKGIYDVQLVDFRRNLTRTLWPS